MVTSEATSSKGHQRRSTCIFPSQTVGVSDPGWLDTSSPRGPGFAAVFELPVIEWDVHTRVIEFRPGAHNTAEIVLTPAGARVPELSWDGVNPTLHMPDHKPVDAGVLGVDYATCLLIDTAAADEFNYGWSVPGPDDRADGAVWHCPAGVPCESGIGDGGYGIWTVTDASDTIRRSLHKPRARRRCIRSRQPCAS